MPRTPFWTQEQEAWLRARCHVTNLNWLTEEYNKAARARGWPPRSKGGIKERTRMVGRPLQTERFPQAVRCAETGRTWPSIRAAARANFITAAGLSAALKANGRWESLELCGSLETTNKS